MRTIALLSLLLALLPGLAGAQTSDAPPGVAVPSQPGTATQVAPVEGFVPDAVALRVPPPQQRLIYSIVVENKEGGSIRVVDPPAQFLLARPGTVIGKVVRPGTKLNTESFHASLWGQPMTVAASAVNAIHIRTFDESNAPRAAVITLLPSELLDHELDGSVAVLRNDQIYTDIPGGRGIFGGAYPVIVGNPACVYRGRDKASFSESKAVLEIGDVIVIEVRAPAQWPRRLQLDNRLGGKLEIYYPTGNPVACGTVEKTVSGTGRFSGGVFCASGGIRATHNGVLDIDFSPLDDVGGMQIIPHAHSLSPELTYSQASPPYGIILGPDGSDMRGQAPVFSGYLYAQSGLEDPLRLPKLLVSVKFRDSAVRGGEAIEIESDGSAWLPLPTLVGREDLSDLTAIRIDWLPPSAKPQAQAAAPPPAPTPQRPAPAAKPKQPKAKAGLKGYSRPARPPRGHDKSGG
jgi:hypothetical protein